MRGREFGEFPNPADSSSVTSAGNVLQYKQNSSSGEACADLGATLADTARLLLHSDAAGRRLEV